MNGEHYYVSEPCLLMKNVIYACCGRDDIACLTEDGAVWVWGENVGTEEKVVHGAVVDYSDEWLKSIVYYDIIPMISEYWFDNDKDLKEWSDILEGMRYRREEGIAKS